ncbi:hypothetical protein [Leisingera sp. S232]|uniref:hypothetical protein n=1 Tax=Leisingera sp. S232 TaxID=3415132 RepID=UPI003C7C4054
MINEQISDCSFSIPDGLKIPAAAKSHPLLVAELNFGEEVTENKWLSELLKGKSLAEFGCNLGLRAAFLAPYTRQIFCTDPDGVCLRLARETLQLNKRRNVVVVDQITQTVSADALLWDTRRYGNESLPELTLQTALLIVTGPLPRSTASKVLDAGYEHLSQYHRAAVFAAPRGQHGVQ